MKWLLRKAGKEETGRINELYIEMLQSIYHTDQVTGYEEDYLDRFFDEGEEWICAAEAGNRMIGFLSIEVHREDREYLYLDDLSVSAGYRNRGIGTALIGRAEAYAEEIGISLIALHVEKTNAAAFRLYERLGYRVLEDQEHRLLMGKDCFGSGEEDNDESNSKRCILRQL